MNYYLCYAREDIRHARYLKELLGERVRGFVDLTEPSYSSDVLETIREEIDASDAVIALHSYAFSSSLLCKIQLVYACKKVPVCYALKLDSAPMEKGFLGEWGEGVFLGGKSIEEAARELLKKERKE